MGPTDYKNRTKSHEKPVRGSGNWVSFTTGLGLGLLTALPVYLWPDLLPRPTALISSIGGELKSQPIPDLPEAVPIESPALPSPKFDFYKILPEIEVTIPQWKLSGDDEDDDRTLESGSYVLQVGSFKLFDEADSVKARLAFLGVAASINRVVINGQDVWYRVHVGPFSNRSDIGAMRIKLIENNMDFMLLKIGAKAST